MGRRHRIAAVVFGIVLAGFVGWLVWGKRQTEPGYKGQPASYWLAVLNTNSVGPAQALEWKDGGADAAKMLLYALTKGDDWRTRAYARFWPKLPGPLRKTLPAPVNYSRVRISAIVILGHLHIETMDLDGELVSSVMQRAIKSTNADIRATAIAIVDNHLKADKLTAEKRGLLPGIVQAVGDPDSTVRHNAIVTLGKFHDQEQVVVPALMTVVNNGSTIGDRHDAMTMLLSMDLPAETKEALVQLLLKWLNDKDHLARMSATQHLGALRSDPIHVVPALAETLGDTNWITRMNAAQALGKFGKQAEAALPALRKALDDPRPEVCTVISNSIRLIAAEPVQSTVK